MNKPTTFTLGVVKVTDKGKLYVEYETEKGSYIFDSNQIPHPDMHEALRELRTYLADSNALRSHRELKFPPKSGAEQVLEQLDKLVYDSVQVSGVSLSGDEKHLAAVITGKHNVHGTAVAMNSPRISTNGDTFKFETALFRAIDKVREEARMFIFEDKQFQSEIFKGDGEEKGKKKAEKVPADVDAKA